MYKSLSFVAALALGRTQKLGHLCMEDDKIVLTWEQRTTAFKEIPAMVGQTLQIRFNGEHDLTAFKTKEDMQTCNLAASQQVAGPTFGGGSGDFPNVYERRLTNAGVLFLSSSQGDDCSAGNLKVVVNVEEANTHGHGHGSTSACAGSEGEHANQIPPCSDLEGVLFKPEEFPAETKTWKVVGNGYCRASDCDGCASEYTEPSYCAESEAACRVMCEKTPGCQGIAYSERLQNGKQWCRRMQLGRCKVYVGDQPVTGLLQSKDKDYLCIAATDSETEPVSRAPEQTVTEAPVEPEALGVGKKTKGNLQLVWAAPANAEAAGEITYQVFARKIGGKGKKKKAGPRVQLEETSSTFANVATKPGLHSFSVVASNNLGSGPAASIVTRTK